MRTLRLLGRDMENGILRRCVLFILPLLFAVSQTRELHAYLIELADGNILLTNGTFADYLLFAMKGMEVYYFDPRSVFYIPIYWFAFQIGLAYFLAYYSSDDLPQMREWCALRPEAEEAGGSASSYTVRWLW